MVEVTPSFQWSAPGGIATIDCQFETVDDAVHVTWLKNDQPLVSNQRTTLMKNATRMQIGDLNRSDTGAYGCRVENRKDAAIGFSVASLLVQEEAVSSPPTAERRHLWLFHANGISIYKDGCNGLLHEIDARDIIPQNGLPLCSKSENEVTLCDWSDTVLYADGKVYAAQPSLNRIVVLHALQLSVVQVIATDPRPRKMWLVPSKKETRIWVLCEGVAESASSAPISGGGSEKKKKDHGFGSYEEEREGDQMEFEWNSAASHHPQLANRKTVQIIRLASSSSFSSTRSQNVIHLQPVDGHFDLVYDLFVPEPSPLQAKNFYNNNR